MSERFIMEMFRSLMPLMADMSHYTLFMCTLYHILFLMFCSTSSADE